MVTSSLKNRHGLQSGWKSIELYGAAPHKWKRWRESRLILQHFCVLSRDSVLFFSRGMARVSAIPCNMVNIIRTMFHKYWVRLVAHIQP